VANVIGVQLRALEVCAQRRPTATGSCNALLGSRVARSYVSLFPSIERVSANVKSEK
jgi:hypothetical protein